MQINQVAFNSLTSKEKEIYFNYLRNKENELLKELYTKSKTDLKLFTKLTFQKVRGREAFKPHWSLDYLLEHLQLVGTGIDQLLVSLPRGYGKSVLISEIFPAWKLIQEPTERLTCFTRSFGSNASSWHRNSFLNYSLDDLKKYTYSDIHEASCSETIFRTKAGGYRRVGSINSSAVGSDLTGVVVDDPVSEEHERSEALRESVEGFYRRGLFPAIRRVPATINQEQLTELQKREHKLTLQLQNEKPILKNKSPWIVHTMQRLHPEDPQAMMLKIKDDLREAGIKQNIVYIALPSIFTEQKIYSFPISKQRYTTKENEYLEAGTLDKNRIDLLRIQLGEEAFQSQMQQNPVASSDVVLRTEYINYYDNSKLKFMQFDSLFMTCDTALSKNKNSDFSVVCCWAGEGEKLYLIDMLRGKFTYELEEELRRFYDKWKFGINNDRFMPRLYIENKASGGVMVEALSKNHNINTEKVERKEDMQLRIRNILHLLKSGCLYIPQEDNLNDVCEQDIRKQFETEYQAFRMSMTHKHDDIISCLCDGFKFLQVEKGFDYGRIADNLSKAFN